MQETASVRIELPPRASVSARKQRDGPAFIGGYGRKIGSSDLLFLEGQLPTRDGVVDRTAPADDQMRQCLANLQQALDRHGKSLDAVLKVTVYLTDFEQYDAVNDAYRKAFDEQVPARSVVGVSELLGGASVQLDAVAAIE